ncbi:muscle M-line assembly protein unc-89-like isoform X2 [Cucurbita moschata]|uniref:Muscle M-line assembly protein unc-89-like isoform X2 n=1 Tax=Cucurbita moschata TaxID=3662 RepID=A0A6J1GBV9_CUCMO|nr:muscle M-line assembly protein unc-89-like isoform X2 [Cucurbita moschata]
MVDGSMDLSMSPETHRSDGDRLRRLSMGKAISLSIDEQNNFRDRRSSIGSCHDICKYGHNHSLETKARVPLLKRAMKKALDAQNSDQAVVVPEKKHSVRVTKSKVSPSSGTCISGGTDVIKRVVPISSPSRRPVETGVTSKSKEQATLVKAPNRQSETEVTSKSKEQATLVKAPNGQSETEVTSESKEPEVPVGSPTKQIEVISENKALVVPMNSPSKKIEVIMVLPVNSPTKRIEVISESKELIVPVNSPTRQIEVISESKELAVPLNSPTRQIEVISESKELVVPLNSPTRQIEVISESQELVVPVNSPTRQSPVEMEVSSESSERVVPENSTSRHSSVEIEATSKNMERVVPETSPSGRSRVEIGVRSEIKEPVVVAESSLSRQGSNRRSPLKSEAMNEGKEQVAKTKTKPITSKPKFHKTTKQVVYSSTKSESSPKQALASVAEAGGDSLSKPKALKAKSVTSSGPSGNIAAHSNNNSKSCEGAGTLKGNGTKVVEKSIITTDPNSVDTVVNLPAIKNKNSKVVSQVKSQNKTRRAQAKEASSVESQEKILHVINVETKKTKLVESDQNDKHGLKGYQKSPTSLANGPSLSPLREDSGGTKYTKYEANATVSGSKKHGGIKKEDDPNGVKKGKSPRMLQTKGKDSSSFSLSFRNKKVIDLDSKRHGPTRLKFMEVKSLGDNQKSKDGRRTSLKKGIVKGISKNSTPPSEKVVLRHQDVEGKKDTQVLFNNVIAETARKLVRTRKSKVKALVGAFEKVISLQDKKPSPLRATA